MKQVLAQLKASGVSGLNKKHVGQIMRCKLGLKYKKSRVVNSRANLLSSRVQRQQFAMRLIQQMVDGKRVINIDESAVGQAVFIRQSWCLKGHKNTHLIKPFGHRLSLIAAIDNLGQAYFAVSQSNVDS